MVSCAGPASGPGPAPTPASHLRWEASQPLLSVGHGSGDGGSSPSGHGPCCRSEPTPMVGAQAGPGTATHPTPAALQRRGPRGAEPSKPRSTRAPGAGLPTAHYYSRYEFEVSQRVPKVIMYRRQRGAVCPGRPGWGHGEGPAWEPSFTLLAEMRPLSATCPTMHPGNCHPPFPWGRPPLCPGQRDGLPPRAGCPPLPPRCPACRVAPGPSSGPPRPSSPHSSKDGSFTCRGVRGYPGGPSLGQAERTIRGRAVPLPTPAPVAARGVDAVLRAGAPAGTAFIHVCGERGVGGGAPTRRPSTPARQQAAQGAARGTPPSGAEPASPVWQVSPCHPAGQWQRPGRTQLPPFWHGGWHIAVEGEACHTPGGRPGPCRGGSGGRGAPLRRQQQGSARGLERVRDAAQPGDNQLAAQVLWGPRDDPAPLTCSAGPGEPAAALPAGAAGVARPGGGRAGAAAVGSPVDGPAACAGAARRQRGPLVFPALPRPSLPGCGAPGR